MCMHVTEEQINPNERYIAHFSKEISSDIKKYAIEDALKFSRYIFTYREDKQQYGYCTHCKASFPTYNLRINEAKTIWLGKKEKRTAECPSCKSKCVLKASGRGRKYMIDEAVFEYYEKSVIDPSILVAREIYVTRDYRYSYMDPIVKYYELALYIFEMGKSAMLKKNYYNDSYFKTVSVYKNVEGHLQNCSYEYSAESIRKAVKGTQFQYSTWDSYSHHTSSLIKFFDLYSQYPCIEYLTKEGFEGLVQDKLYGRGSYGAVNWKADSIFKVLKLNKNDLRLLREFKFKNDALFLRLFQMSKKDGSNLSIKETEEVREYGSYYKELLAVHKYANLRKINNYLKQQLKRKNDFIFKYSIMTTWRDYISDCITLDMNLKDEHVLFPKSLYSAHQNTIKQVKLQADETLNLKMKDRMKFLGKYCLEYNGLFIRPAKSSDELIAEGKALSHCVGTYADRYAKGETNIFFIRKVLEPDKPYFTVEVNNKNVVVQVHGKNNRSPDTEVGQFMKVFKKEKLTKKNIKNQVQVTVSA